MRLVRVRFNRKEKFVAALAACVVLLGGAAGAFFLGGASQSVGCKETGSLNGLIGWWKMDGNANDSTTYHNNGTVTSATLTTDRSGASNCAYSFGGVGSIATNYVQTSVTNYTVSAWVNTTTTAAEQVVEQDRGSGAGQSLTLLVGVDGGAQGAAGDVQFEDDSNGTDIGVHSTTTVNSGGWHHIVGVFSGGGAVSASQFKIYIDGSPATTANNAIGSATAPLTGLTGMSIGSHQAWGTHFNGSLDDLQIYNRALSAAEVLKLYRGTAASLALDSGENSLIGWWKLDGNAKDSTPYRDNGTVTAATLTTDREGAANSAYSFDGSTTSISTPALAGGGLSTSNITYTAWIDPASIPQGTYTGIMFSRASTQPIGMSFGSDGKYLSYTWNNNSSLTYNWNSGLNPVVNKWNFVAITINSSAANAYLGVVGTNTTLSTATNSIGHSSQAVNGPFVIGNDTGFSGRHFNGKIDDVRIYNRTLSTAELNTLYQEYNSQVMPSSLQQGEVGDWPFNGNANDSTPYRDAGTVTSSTLTTDREARANSAYSMNGSSSTIALGNPSILQFDRTSSFSIGAWIKTSSAAAGQTIVSKMADSAPFTGYEFGLLGGIVNLYLINTWTSNTIQVSTTATVNNNQWRYVTVTYSGNSSATGVHIYIDGAPVSTTSAFNSLSGTILNSIPVQIGSRNNTNYHFNGSMDDVRIWNRALSAAEVALLAKEYR